MKLTKIASALALSAALSLGLVPAAFADSTATYTDHEEVLVFAEGTAYHETDLFDGLKDVMPGDERSQKVVIENDHSREANFYLAVETHDEANPPAYVLPGQGPQGPEGPVEGDVAQPMSEDGSEADGGAEDPGTESVPVPGEDGRETAASMADFLSKLSMRVTLGDRVLFEGAPSEAGSLEKPVLLGEIAPGKSMELLVELSVPAELGNEYAYRVGEVDWVFTVEELDPALPDTGDTLPVGAIAAVAALALAAAAALLVASRRRNSER